MKKLLFLFVLCLCRNFFVSAQITLNYSDYPVSVLGTDSLKVTTYRSTFPPLVPATAGMWDLSSVTDSVPDFFNYRVVTDTPYQYADSSYVFYFFGLPFNYSTYNSISATGAFCNGEKVGDTSYSISLFTGGVSDSLFVESQSVLFSSNCMKISLPSRYNDVWTSHYQFDLNYQLSCSFFSLNHAPGIVRSFVTERDTVTGWGQVRVKDHSGAPSAWWDVLQVERTIITRDSFYLNGTLMPNTILTTFGLVQGSSDTTYEQCYYRKGEVTPLARVAFRDANFTTPYKATTHVQRLVPSGVPTLSGKAVFQVFPNPVATGVVSVVLPYISSEFTYRLCDGTGRQMAQGEIECTGNRANIKLPAQLPTGEYFFQVMEEGRQVYATQLQIAR